MAHEERGHVQRRIGPGKLQLHLAPLSPSRLGV